MTHNWPIDSNTFQIATADDLTCDSPTLTKNRFGEDQSAFEVSNENNYVYMSNEALFESTFSISVWMMTYDDTTTWARVFDFNSGTSDYIAITYLNDDSLKPGVEIATSGTKYSAYVGSRIPNIAWTHFVLAANSSKAVFYINGEWVGEIVFPTPQDFAVSRTNNYFGRSSSDVYSNSAYDEIKIFNNFLSDSEVADEYTLASDTFKGSVDRGNQSSLENFDFLLTFII